MKKLLITLSAVAFVFSSLSAFAADEEKTIKGDGQCAKCSLKKADACQNAIVAKEDGKEVVYFLDKNEVSTKFHKNICQGIKKVQAKGTVKEQDGKKILVAKSIELVEEKK